MKVVLILLFIGLCGAKPFWPFYHLYKVHPVPYVIEQVQPVPPTNNPETWKIISEHAGFVYVHPDHLPGKRVNDEIVKTKEEKDEATVVAPKKELELPKEDIKTRTDEEKVDEEKEAVVVENKSSKYSEEDEEDLKDTLTPPQKESTWTKAESVKKPPKKVPIVKGLEYVPPFVLSPPLFPHHVVEIEHQGYQPRITITKYLYNRQ